MSFLNVINLFLEWMIGFLGFLFFIEFLLAENNKTLADTVKGIQEKYINPDTYIGIKFTLAHKVIGSIYRKLVNQAWTELTRIDGFVLIAFCLFISYIFIFFGSFNTNEKIEIFIIVLALILSFYGNYIIQEKFKKQKHTFFIYIGLLIIIFIPAGWPMNLGITNTMNNIMIIKEMNFPKFIVFILFIFFIYTFRNSIKINITSIKISKFIAIPGKMILYGFLSVCSWIYLYEYTFRSGDEAFVQFIYDIPFLIILFFFSIACPILTLNLLSLGIVYLAHYIVARVSTVNVLEFGGKDKLNTTLLTFTTIFLLYIILRMLRISPLTFHIQNSDIQTIFHLLVPSGIPILLIILSIYNLLQFKENLKDENSSIIKL